MSTIVFSCKAHGSLVATQCFTVKKKTGRINYQCKLCKVEKMHLWRDKHKEAYIEGRRAYQRNRLRQNSAELNDSYVKKMLHMPGIEIPQPLIELKRATLQIKRITRAKRQEDLENYMQQKFINDNTHCK